MRTYSRATNGTRKAEHTQLHQQMKQLDPERHGRERGSNKHDLASNVHRQDAIAATRDADDAAHIDQHAERTRDREPQLGEGR